MEILDECMGIIIIIYKQYTLFSWYMRLTSYVPYFYD